MTTYTVKYSLIAADESFTTEAQVTLICDFRTVTASPDSREEMYVEKAVLRVNGAEVPHTFNRGQLARMLAAARADELEGIAA